jgi:hypothetical protein
MLVEPVLAAYGPVDRSVSQDVMDRTVMKIKEFDFNGLEL